MAPNKLPGMHFNIHEKSQDTNSRYLVYILIFNIMFQIIVLFYVIIIYSNF